MNEKGAGGRGDEEFSKRLNQACDAHQLVPPLHMGRLTWIQREFYRRFNEKISAESIRKWFSAESRPRAQKVAMLAELLDVDVAWLSLGRQVDLAPREQKLRNAEVDGVVNVVAGLIQMDGGHPAFPEQGDANARNRKIDLHAIIRGGKYDIHVSLGEAVDGGLRFPVPVGVDNVVVLGVYRQDFALQVYEITPEAIEAGQRRAGVVDVIAEPGDGKLRRIENFRNRL